MAWEPPAQPQQVQPNPQYGVPYVPQNGGAGAPANTPSPYAPPANTPPEYNTGNYNAGPNPGSYNAGPNTGSYNAGSRYSNTPGPGYQAPGGQPMNPNYNY